MIEFVDRNIFCPMCGINKLTHGCFCESDPRDTSDESTKDNMQPEINEPIE